MKPDPNTKIIEHEYTLIAHDKRITAMENKQGHMNTTLDSILKVMNQIKTAIVTSIVILSLLQLGIVDTVKRFLL